jgi:RNA polymerase sigma factor (sigma-70 family)
MERAVRANMIQGQMSIEEIWEGVIAGQATMQRQLYTITFKTMMGICNRYATTLEDAEQWVHDGYVKIFTLTEKYANTGSLEGWMRRIMVNTCLDNLRTVKAQYNAPHLRTKETAAIGHDYSTANEALLDMQAEHLMLHIKALPATQKTVFNMYALDGYSHKEIALQLGMKESNSQWHLNQARQFLKNKIIQAHQNSTQAK